LSQSACSTSRRGDDDHVDRLGQRRLLGLVHGDAEPHRGLLRRRRPDAPAASLRRVRTGEQVGDVVRRGQPLEHVGADRRGRGDREAH